MNRFMDDRAIGDEQSFSEQHPRDDNHQRENLPQTQPDLVVSGDVVRTIKRTPMTPTYLYTSFLLLLSAIIMYILLFLGNLPFCSRHRVAIAISASVVFASVTMIVGILIVCFTSPKPAGMFSFYPK